MSNSNRLEDHRCGACGEQATMAARDVAEKPIVYPEVRVYKEYEYIGEWKFGCDEHPVQSNRY